MAKPLPDPRPRSRWAAGLPAVTADRIVDTALELTAEQGLDGWTLRRLATRLDTYPSVIYHHVGDREAVVSAIVERVVGTLPIPPADMFWRDWFRVLLRELRAALRRYPGVAHRMALYGPGVSAAAPIIDRGVTLLRDAGLGREAVLAYNMLLSVACQLLALEDDRERSQAAREQMSRAYAAAGDQDDRPGLAALGELVRDLSGRPERLAGYYAASYDYGIERCLDGLAARLAEISP